jgi:hypothetical protein
MCKIYKILYAAIPVRKWKSALIRRHFDRCPRCAEEIFIKEHAVHAIFKPDWIQGASDQWPQIRPRIFSHEVQFQRFRPAISPSRVQARRWSLAAATAAFLILGTIGFFILQQYSHKTPGPESNSSREPAAFVSRVRVISTELGGKRAKAYIYQTPTATFIWITPAKEIGG